jgi:rsbT co-antagonist protein RsbR
MRAQGAPTLEGLMRQIVEARVCRREGLRVSDTLTPSDFIPQDPEALQLFWQVYEVNYDAVNASLMERIGRYPELRALMDSMPPEVREEQNRRSKEQMRRALQEGAWQEFTESLAEQGAGYARAGMTFSSWMVVVSMFRNDMIPRLIDAHGSDKEKLRRTVAVTDGFGDLALSVIGQAYMTEKERVIGNQQEAIRELATPVLSVRPSLLILPLIGVIDSDRARQVTEQLLEAIVRHRAKAVVVDITGVPAVDSMVANHLIQTAEAARLMGARVVVTGVSTANAQTLVRIGVDPSRLKTAGDLQSGIEWAEAYLRRLAEGDSISAGPGEGAGAGVAE